MLCLLTYHLSDIHVVELIQLKETHREKVPPNETPELTKVQIWAFGLLVQQINSLEEVLKLKQNFQKNKEVTGKTPFSLIGPFCSHHFICLNIGF